MTWTACYDNPLSPFIKGDYYSLLTTHDSPITDYRLPITDFD